MRMAIRLAKKAEGMTSPNPIVGALLVKGGEIIGKGYHRRAGLPHAEIEAINDAREKGFSPANSTLFVTLEPCSTYGRTPPCVDAIIKEKIKAVVVGATDPNPKHSGKAYEILKSAGIRVKYGVLESECAGLNEGFNHWIVNKTPFVIVKSAMTLDGKIATAGGDSRWITSPLARKFGMRLRKIADAILAGVNTIIADNPALTYRDNNRKSAEKPLRRIVLDSKCRIPLDSNVISDEFSNLTTVVVTEKAPKEKLARLKEKCNVIVAPEDSRARVDIQWLLKKLGEENVLTLLVEGGGEVNASFFSARAARRVVFFYAPKIVCGLSAPRAVAGDGFKSFDEIIRLDSIKWKKIGDELMLSALVKYP